MERIDEFTVDGKNFMYIDLSHIKKNDIFLEVSSAATQSAAKYPEKSVYTIINIEGTMFDTDTKIIAAQCFEQNTPFVKYGAVIGLDGIKKIMLNAAFKISGRNNMHFCLNKEHAIEWLLQQE